jgi:pimeloyl-ACP methyl ester carboxylesterase
MASGDIMPRIRPRNLRILILAAVFGMVAGSGLAKQNAAEPQIHAASIGHGITLHYVDEGAGVPVVFVHGSLSNDGYWADQIGPFSKHYRAIAYSRRYNHPNTNPARPGYSAVVDSDDLAAFIRTLRLGKVIVIGHSYGALTALFLAARYPQLVRALVLAEPPAVSLLAELHGEERERGKTMFDDIQQRMVKPMRQAYQKGDREEGIRIFMAYVFNDPHAWDKMPQSSRDQTLQDAHEWDVMLTTGTLFPAITPQAVQSISAPVLILMGAKSYPFLGVIGHELARLLPKSRTIAFPDAGHQMWLQDPEACRNDVEEFLADLGIR